MVRGKMIDKGGIVLRDLKHLIFFENLLQEANNELVQRACAQGKLALAYNCSYIPEVLLDMEGSFSVRLRAPRCFSPDLATYYMTNRSCPYSRSILERAFEGGYNFIDALMGQECCTTMNRMEQYFDYCKLIPKEKFFISYIDMPLKKTPWHAGYFRRQLEQKVIEPLSRVYGLDFSEEKLLQAIQRHNELCRVIQQLGDFRKLENPPITGYEFHVIQLVSLTCPKELILPYLKETLEEVRQREPDPAPAYRVRVMLVGSEVDDPEFTRLLESCGAYVAADRYCFGSLPGREEIVVKPGQDALQAIADAYMYNNQCPRAMGPDNIVGRKQYMYALAKEYGADGIIVQNMKFCEYWGYERAQMAAWLRESYELPESLPVCQIERDYTIAATGQLRTRFQAFVESLEIKRIQVGN